MSGQRKGRVGVKGAANMDVFNISLLKMLKTKNERLSLMERMSNVNVDLGRYIEPEEEIPLVVDPSERSNWAEKLDRIKAQRSTGENWVERFADKVEDMEIYDTRSASEIRALPKTTEEKHRNMIARGIFMSKVIRPPQIPRHPHERKAEDFQEYKKQVHGQVHMCCKCWRGAGPGPGRVDCSYCGAFAHIGCLEAKDEIKRKFVGDSSYSNELTSGQEGEEEKASKWMCPFCQDSLDAENKYIRRKFEKEMYKYRTVRAVIRMQAAIRARITGAWFHRVVQAVKLVQRVVRNRQFWKAEEMKKKLIKRPVRIRLHDIDVFVKQALGQEKGRPPKMCVGAGPALAPLPQDSHKVGDMPMIQYEDAFGYGSSGDTANRGAEMMPMVNLLRIEHQFAPSYCDPCSTAKRPKGEMMMSVSIHQVLEDGLDVGRQEYRIDIPLVADGPANRIIARRGKGGGSAQLHKSGAHEDLDNDEVKELARDYRVRTYRVAQNRPYILIPFITAETLLRITLSEVTDWPKARVCGQIETPIFHYLLWKRMASYVDDFQNPVGWHNLPNHSDGSALTLVLPKETPVKGKKDRSERGSGKGGGGASPLPSIPNSMAASPRKSEKGDGRRRRGGGLPGLGSPPGGAAPATPTAASSTTTTTTDSQAALDNPAMGIGDASALAAAITAKFAETEAKERKEEEREAKVGGAKQGVPKASSAVTPPTANKAAWDVPVGGFLTWSILPITDAGDCHYGSMTNYSAASLTSSKKRLYFVLLDRVLLVYNPNMIKPRYSFPVSSLGVSATEGAEKMITVKNPNETLFLVADEDAEGRAWFKKLYNQSWAAPRKQYGMLRPFPGGHPFGPDGSGARATLGTTSADRKDDLMVALRSLVKAKK